MMRIRFRVDVKGSLCYPFRVADATPSQRADVPSRRTRKEDCQMSVVAIAVTTLGIPGFPKKGKNSGRR